MKAKENESKKNSSFTQLPDLPFHTSRGRTGGSRAPPV
jgi:hypothetical protein